MSEVCPLCLTKTEAALKHQHVQGHLFFHCSSCDLIFVPKSLHVSPEKEKARYQAHQNNPLENGYRDFLLKFSTPVLNYLQEKKIKIDSALDYGAGEGSPLAGIFAEEKLKVYEYDPYFKNFPHLLQQKYDLVMATEVIEHFRDPKIDLLKVQELVKTARYLALMTQFHQGPEHFQTWWYAKDFTHVSFYSEKTFRYWAQTQKLNIRYLKNPTVIFSLA